MYVNVHRRAILGGGYSNQFPVKVGEHKGSVVSPLLFIIVLEALLRYVLQAVSRKICTLTAGFLPPSRDLSPRRTLAFANRPL